MRFQILSHAGIMVEHHGVQVLCDPWLVGSTYWRSWWNYPPVERELIKSLKPDAIYLTHIHWDHFQGPSLKLFPRDTKIIVPRGHFDRMRRDLNTLGFDNVQELGHGETVELGKDFRLTSYSFDLLCDSAVVLESSTVTLLNLNDCKIMGRPMRHMLSRHRRPEFVFASHSSANSRICFDFIDSDETAADDSERYIERFYQFVKASGARFAVPCASNQCYLHKETFHFNSANRTPIMVRDYWQKHGVTDPELAVMVSGDSWCEEADFSLTTTDWFTERDRLLREYQDRESFRLTETYRKEDKARVKLTQMERFFAPFFRAVPWVLRRRFRAHPIAYVLYAGEHRQYFEVDVSKKQVTELENVSDETHPAQFHLSAFVLRHAMSANIVAHIGISKRVRYRSTLSEKKYVELFRDLLARYEYENLPLTNLLSWRSIRNWASRWREVLLYVSLVKDKLMTGRLPIEKHLVPPPVAQAQPSTSREHSAA